MKVYVVLHDNFGDQGVAFHGVFATKLAAQQYIKKKEKSKDERQWWEIEEVEVQY